MVHEKIAGIINDHSKLFDQNWEPWATYIPVPLSMTPCTVQVWDTSPSTSTLSL